MPCCYKSVTKVLELFPFCSAWRTLARDSAGVLLIDTGRSSGRQSGSLPERRGEKGETDERTKGEGRGGVPFYSFNP